ncbi:MAG: transposase [Verrucomicrobiota bacterium]|nr:transposase [Verrucomicrobiota bacterium]
MTRPLRMKVAGGWYHVMARGYNRDRIFVDRQDYEHFLQGVEEMTRRFWVRVYAYSLMPNHYHLLLSTPEGNVSGAIRWLNIRHSVVFNRRGALGSHLHIAQLAD